ncbi:Bacterioferritin-associated ferredoxin [Actinacidiphila rubida]|uniref:Bacterioferritin-associated ferredoxin n=1 Tax=Actinacidiphila rubida TaxID=310780 RepID=A0A1H8IPL1_9ACTN|nr:(2Fe-2S)-binding protein [Actinacidiphila rubida]SEN70025.1 Bacterioferritin-associated ferredoxin [Actinacidiphila rubida]
MYVCSCFGITEQQVRQHADSGRCTPRQIASACKAGTDCGSCVKRIQALLGRGSGCATRDRLEPAATSPAQAPAGPDAPATAPEPSAAPVAPVVPVAPIVPLAPAA